MSTLRRLRRLFEGQAGYSLIELVIVLAILGTVVGALTTLFVQATNAEFEMNRRFQAQQSARVAVDKMRREIHCASAVTPTGAQASISVTVPSQCVSVCPLTPPVCAAGQPPTTVTYDTAGSGTRYQLRRNGVNLADYVTLNNVFNYTAPVTGASLGKLRVTLPINTKPGSGKEWRLVADMVLRNTTR
jgi:prepilin-type N-terminal cleavage/methylation domain-containing protein